MLDGLKIIYRMAQGKFISKIKTTYKLYSNKVRLIVKMAFSSKKIWIIIVDLLKIRSRKVLEPFSKIIK